VLMALTTRLGQIAVGLLMLTGSGAVAAAIGLVGALTARGGFTFRLFGHAIVTGRGSEISRLRALSRAVIAWLPLGLLCLLLWLGPGPKHPTVGWIAIQIAVVAILAGGAAWAIARPARGIQDWIAATWIVPR
jgi:hypothetical protein